MPLNFEEREELVSQVLDEIFGLGPLEPLIQDPEVSDILVNTYKQVYIERHGRLERTDVRFQDDRHLLQVIDRIVSAVGRRIDDSSPMVDARLPDGSRVNAIIKPLALDGPHLSIRKFKRDALSGEDLLRTESLTEPMLELLQGDREGPAQRADLGRHRRRQDDAAQHPLVVHPAHRADRHDRGLGRAPAHASRTWCGWRPGPPTSKGTGEVPQRLLLINALRMRPDRIIMGECRGGEAVDMLQAMNTGHDGSLTTLHANTPRDALSRLETMISMASLDLPEKAMRQQIASAINVVIQVSRLSDGTRKMIQISEIVGMEGDVITMQDIFVFEREGIGETTRCWAGSGPPASGPGSPTGSRPTASISPRCCSPTSTAGDRRGTGAAMVDLPASILGRRALIAFLAVALGTVSLALLLEWLQEQQPQAGGGRPAPRLRPTVDSRAGPGSTVFRVGCARSPRWLRPIVGPRARAAGPRSCMLQQAGITWTLQTLLLMSLGLPSALGSVALIVTGSGRGRAWPRPCSAAMLPYLLRPPPANPADRRLRGAAPRGHRPAGPRHPRRPSALVRAQDGGGRGSGADRRRVPPDLRGAAVRAAASRTRCSAMADRVDLVDVRILVTAILIQREVGGNLAEVLDNLAAVIRARFTIRRQLRVYTAQGRMSGYVLAALPLIVVRDSLHAEPRVHDDPVHRPDRQVSCWSAVSMQLIGFLWIRKIVNIEI